jgi:hypothetical protein
VMRKPNARHGLARTDQPVASVSQICANAPVTGRCIAS